MRSSLLALGQVLCLAASTAGQPVHGWIPLLSNAPAGGTFQSGQSYRNYHLKLEYQKASATAAFEAEIQYRGEPVRLPEPQQGGEWDTFEVYVSEETSVHVHNGKVIHRQKLATPIEEPIALRGDPQRVTFRNVRIRPLHTRGGGPGYRVLVFSKISTISFLRRCSCSVPLRFAAFSSLARSRRYTN